MMQTHSQEAEEEQMMDPEAKMTHAKVCYDVFTENHLDSVSH